MMKIIWIVLAAVLGVAAIYGFTKRVSPEKRQALIASTPKSFYELSYTSIDGKKIQMSDYKGKYVLCVNVASKCGYTPQYETLEKLYESHKDNLIIVGFPCNQFLFQEPGSEAEIATFCQKNYGVTFPLSSKLDVKGDKQDPLYSWLTMEELNGVASNDVKWNFHKFLISPEGKWMASFGSKVEPLSAEITDLIK
jgi:glutathione peroxidase